MIKPQYIYVMVRKDLPIWDQMVQVGHACFDGGKHFSRKWKPETHLILLQVENEKELNEWQERLSEKEVKFTTFYEPDPALEIDENPMGHTALCTEPLKGRKRDIFKDCVMWVP